MAFITYILVSGFVFGLQKRYVKISEIYSKCSSIFSFTPEKLGMLTTNALFYIIFENVIVFIMKYALNISQSLNIWHALAYSAYKFTGFFISRFSSKLFLNFRMVLCLLLYIIGGSKIYYAALIYCILCTVFFLVSTKLLFINTAKNLVTKFKNIYP